MNLRKDQERMYNLAKEKGWHDKELEKTWRECSMLLVSEISEALEEYRANKGFNEVYSVPDKPEKPEGISIELADYYIRLCDMAEQFQIDLQFCVSDISLVFVPGPSASFTENLFWLTKVTTDLWDKNTIRSDKLGLCYLTLDNICKRFNINLESAVEIKFKYNKTRSYRHGNKKV